MKDLDIKFPLEEYEELIKQIGWRSLDEWFKFWESKKNQLFLEKYWDHNVKQDWIWGLALPLLSRAYNFKNEFSKRKLIGISALPGTGKTTLGNWLENISLNLNFKLSVISIDDFYLPSGDMEFAIKNNPWNVSRGFPGTHSIDLMKNKLLEWKYNGKLNVPVFDKSLRNGLGDRSHWRSDNPDVLILEGWFLGVKPLSYDFSNNDKFDPPLDFNENSYRNNIQENLKQYMGIWNLIDEIWHLKPSKFEYMNLWKTNQEREMLLRKGSALKDKKLENFLRMLNVSIPHESFDLIDSDVSLLINKDRRLIKVGLN